MDRLEIAIRSLYAAFADIPRPTLIEGCPCCIEAKDVDTLLGTDRADLSPAELSGYASSAFLTVGAVADSLYFLPRILEISATEPRWWPSPEVTARAIAAAGFDSWPATRRGSVADFLRAVIESAVESEQSDEIDSWICAIGRMGSDVRPYLDLIASSPAAVLAFFDDNIPDLSKGRLRNSFWECPSEAHDAVVAWFRSEPVRSIPHAAYGFEF